MATMDEEAEAPGSALTLEQQRVGHYAELTEEQERQLRAKMLTVLEEHEGESEITSTELAEQAANELHLHCDDAEATIPERVFELALEVMEAA
jgi:hypothetical protein